MGRHRHYSIRNPGVPGLRLGLAIGLALLGCAVLAWQVTAVVIARPAPPVPVPSTPSATPSGRLPAVARWATPVPPPPATVPVRNVPRPAQTTPERSPEPRGSEQPTQEPTLPGPQRSPGPADPGFPPPPGPLPSIVPEAD
ncbi:hypothetical protein [Rhizohabitans arisaemae]|uniref:hypothetical protein n=1 Tax=Rhizohabitans arisaemae TaxID=2720610 RepID=UPI0024B1DE09|nr:hypothetical protein [Rhizohabitans arisaemae]